MKLIYSLILALALTLGASAQNFVQKISGPTTPTASLSTVSVVLPTSQVAGNTNVVAVGWADTAHTVSSLTDTRGNIYTLIVGPTSIAGTVAASQSLYYAKNIAGGANTVTVTFNAATAFPDLRVIEYAGLDKVNPLDAKAAATGTGTTGNSGTAVSTLGSELIFGAGTTTGSFNAPGPGFFSRDVNAFGSIVEDKAVSVVGSYSATAALAGTANWVMQVATFRVAVHQTVLTITPPVALAGVVVTSYNIYKATASGAYIKGSPYATVPAGSGAVTFIDPATSGQTTFFVATAVCSTCTVPESVFSAEISGTTPTSSVTTPNAPGLSGIWQ